MLLRNKQSYKIIEPAKPESEPRALLTEVPHQETDLIVGHPAFGKNTYRNNLQKMQGNFSCLLQYPQMSFSPATTSESISIAAHTFGDLTKPKIFDISGLQSGYIGRTSEGIFLNLPRDDQRDLVTDEQTLKSYLNGTEPTNVRKGKVRQLNFPILRKSLPQ